MTESTSSSSLSGSLSSVLPAPSEAPPVDLKTVYAFRTYNRDAEYKEHIRNDLEGGVHSRVTLLHDDLKKDFRIRKASNEQQPMSVVKALSGLSYGAFKVTIYTLPVILFLVPAWWYAVIIGAGAIAVFYLPHLLWNNRIKKYDKEQEWLETNQEMFSHPDLRNPIIEDLLANDQRLYSNKLRHNSNLPRYQQWMRSLFFECKYSPFRNLSPIADRWGLETFLSSIKLASTGEQEEFEKKLSALKEKKEDGIPITQDEIDDLLKTGDVALNPVRSLLSVAPPTDPKKAEVERLVNLYNRAQLDFGQIIEIRDCLEVLGYQLTLRLDETALMREMHLAFEALFKDCFYNEQIKGENNVLKERILAIETDEDWNEFVEDVAGMETNPFIDRILQIRTPEQKQQLILDIKNDFLKERKFLRAETKDQWQSLIKAVDNNPKLVYQIKRNSYFLSKLLGSCKEHFFFQEKSVERELFGTPPPLNKTVIAYLENEMVEGCLDREMTVGDLNIEGEHGFRFSKWCETHPSFKDKTIEFVIKHEKLMHWMLDHLPEILNTPFVEKPLGERILSQRTIAILGASNSKYGSRHQQQIITLEHELKADFPEVEYWLLKNPEMRVATLYEVILAHREITGYNRRNGEHVKGALEVCQESFKALRDEKGLTAEVRENRLNNFKKTQLLPLRELVRKQGERSVWSSYVRWLTRTKFCYPPFGAATHTRPLSNGGRIEAYRQEIDKMPTKGAEGEIQAARDMLDLIKGSLGIKSPAKIKGLLIEYHSSFHLPLRQSVWKVQVDTGPPPSTFEPSLRTSFGPQTLIHAYRDELTNMSSKPEASKYSEDLNKAFETLANIEASLYPDQEVAASSTEPKKPQLPPKEVLVAYHKEQHFPLRRNIWRARYDYGPPAPAFYHRREKMNQKQLKESDGYLSFGAKSFRLLHGGLFNFALAIYLIMAYQYFWTMWAGGIYMALNIAGDLGAFWKNKYLRKHFTHLKNRRLDELQINNPLLKTGDAAQGTASKMHVSKTCPVEVQFKKLSDQLGLEDNRTLGKKREQETYFSERGLDLAQKTLESYRKGRVNRELLIETKKAGKKEAKDALCDYLVKHPEKDNEKWTRVLEPPNPKRDNNERLSDLKRKLIRVRDKDEYQPFLNDNKELKSKIKQLIDLLGQIGQKKRQTSEIQRCLIQLKEEIVRLQSDKKEEYHEYQRKSSLLYKKEQLEQQIRRAENPTEIEICISDAQKLPDLETKLAQIEEEIRELDAVQMKEEEALILHALDELLFPIQSLIVRLSPEMGIETEKAWKGEIGPIVNSINSKKLELESYRNQLAQVIENEVNTKERLERLLKPLAENIQRDKISEVTRKGAKRREDLAKTLNRGKIDFVTAKRFEFEAHLREKERLKREIWRTEELLKIDQQKRELVRRKFALKQQIKDHLEDELTAISAKLEHLNFQVAEVEKNYKDRVDNFEVFVKFDLCRIESSWLKIRIATLRSKIEKLETKIEKFWPFIRDDFKSTRVECSREGIKLLNNKILNLQDLKIKGVEEEIFNLRGLINYIYYRVLNTDLKKAENELKITENEQNNQLSKLPHFWCEQQLDEEEEIVMKTEEGSLKSNTTKGKERI